MGERDREELMAMTDPSESDAGEYEVQFSIQEQLLGKNVKRFRGGLVFKAHRLLYHSALGLRVTAGRERMGERDREELMAMTDPSESDAGEYEVASHHDHGYRQRERARERERASERTRLARQHSGCRV